ncbi:MAG: DUF4276 family protein [Bacteroidales bacterium]|nr:DUF4276 family protein [Bacteroidales bacterium]
MSKVGFIVEDKPYQKFIESENFIELLSNLNVELTGVHKSPNGRDCFFSENGDIQSFVKILKDKETDYIFILIDKEDDPCISFSKGRIHVYEQNIQINIIAVKAIESWFLADSETLSCIFNVNNYQYNDPEGMTEKPFEILKSEFIKNREGRGISKKRNLHATKMINNGFSLENAAKHPNCPSAKYFLQKLSQLNPNS